jgi:uncharacterized protein with NRDE domain
MVWSALALTFDPSMCLAAFAFGQSARFPFVLLANRDEAFDRPTGAMAWWPATDGGSRLLAGRDLSAGGTWLGLTETGRLALVTNVREPGRTLPAAPSRGELVPRWLRGGAAVHDDAALGALTEAPRNGFNLVVADLAASAPGAARWLSNRPQTRQRALQGGVHAVSNASIDTPWPKLLRLKQRLADLMASASDLHTLESGGFTALADPAVAPDAELPDTGLPLLRERQLSAAFIRVTADDPARAVYGTRCATLVVVEQENTQRRVLAIERSFGPAGDAVNEVRYGWSLPAS